MPFDTTRSLTIRRGQPADLAPIQALLEQCGLPLPADEWTISFWLAEQDGQLLGVVAAQDLGVHWLVRSLAVAPEQRGGGVAHQLLRQLWLAADDAHISALYLVTNDQRGFFERLGFVVADRSALPSAIANCSQLLGECPASATVMALTLAPGVWLRRATTADLGAVVAIYNEAVKETTACYDYEPRTLAVQQQLFADKEAAGHPLLVAERPDRSIVGFATLGFFRPRAGWRPTCEHSVYVTTAAQGLGIGSRLLPAVIAHASSCGFHGMVGVVDAANQGSLALHQRFGFEIMGIMKEGGYKFDRWLDVAFVHRLLPAANCDLAHK